MNSIAATASAQRTRLQHLKITNQQKRNIKKGMSVYVHTAKDTSSLLYHNTATTLSSPSLRSARRPTSPYSHSPRHSHCHCHHPQSSALQKNHWSAAPQGLSWDSASDPS